MSDRSEARTRKELINLNFKGAGSFEQDMDCFLKVLCSLEKSIKS